MHTDSTRPTTLARQPRPPGKRFGRRSSERSIPTVCSNQKSALDVPRMPEQPTSLASPISPLGHGLHARDDRNRGTAICSSPIPRMRPDPNRRNPTYRSAAGPSGLRRACRRPVADNPEPWRSTLHPTVVGLGRPTTTQCLDFTLELSAEWTQLP